MYLSFPSTRHSDPDSGGSSFSFLLDNAPHLDGQVFNTTSKLHNQYQLLH
jgi:hypothetical protein